MKLRSAVELWKEYVGGSCGELRLCRLIKADRDAVRDVIAHDVVLTAVKMGYAANSLLVEALGKAAHNAGKVDDTRERLGRIAWEAWVNHQGEPKAFDTWDTLTDNGREQNCIVAQAVLTEQRKIEEEASDD